MRADRATYRTAGAVLASIAACAGAGISPAIAESGVPCAVSAFTVTAEDETDITLVCEAITKAVDLLGTCGLEPRRPVSVEIVPQIEGAGLVDCVGSYDCNASRIELVSMSRIEDMLSDENPFPVLDLKEYFDSIVVHEVTHALFDQITEGRSLAELEYVAYAMQFESLSRASRDHVLSLFPDIGDVSPEELNDFIAAAAPIRFGAKAWTHFAAPGNGCAFVEELLSGEESLKLQPL